MTNVDVFYPKALVVTVEKQNINTVTTSLLNMGASILGITDAHRSVSKSNITALLRKENVLDDIKFDIIRRKLEFKYANKETA